MTHKSLQKLIEILNKKLLPKEYFLKSKSSFAENIDYFIFQSKVVDNWTGKQEYYLLKQNGKYVGLVFDMYPDQHWYMFKKYRGKGIMYSSLKDHILPYILKTKGPIEITISSWQSDPSTTQLAERLGFKKTGEKKYNEDTEIESREYKFILRKQ